MSERGRPPKRVYISQRAAIALCADCPLRRCVGTGDARCPIRITSRRLWRRDNRKRVEYQRARYLARKANT